MSDAKLTLAMAELQEVVRCRCDEAYRDRGLKDPHCECDSAEAVKVVADRIEALTAERDTAREYAGEVRIREKVAEDARIEAEAKLAKAVETLREIEVDFCQTDVALKYAIHTVLAELEGKE